MCVCNFACKGRPQNDLYCDGWDVKCYSLNHSVDVSPVISKELHF